MNRQEKPFIKEIAGNRKARFHFEILETFEVGIVLTGTEIKSLKAHGAHIEEAYITCDKKELWLISCSITPYTFGNIYNHEEKRKRKLLAHKKEILAIQNAVQEKKLTCIPLSIYLKNGVAKLSIAIARGKKLYDKRETIKEREDKRAIDRMMKNQ